MDTSGTAPALAGGTNKLENLPQMVQGVMGTDPAIQTECTTQFRRLLSIEKNPPIQQVIDSGVVPRFVEFLQRDDNPALQFEAAWALTNIASGTSEHTKVVMEVGAVPIFVRLLLSPNDDAREQAVWALGNIAGDSPPCRDLVLQAGAMQPLLQQLHQGSKLSMLRNATCKRAERNFRHGYLRWPERAIDRASEEHVRAMRRLRECLGADSRGEPLRWTAELDDFHDLVHEWPCSELAKDAMLCWLDAQLAQLAAQ